jgi:MFS family permease
MYMSRASTSSLDLRFVFWLSWVQLISWGSVFYGFSLFMAPLELELGMTRAQSSLGFSLALLAEGLLAFWVGRRIDQGHERILMTGGSLLIGISFIAHSFVTDTTGFYLAWLGLGIGLSATLYPPAFAVLTRRFPNDFRRAIILLTFLGGLASTVFIPLIAWLMAVTDWRTTMGLLGGLHLLVCAPLHAWLLKPTPAQNKIIHTSQLEVRKTTSIRTHIQHPNYWALSLFVIVLMTVTTALPAHMVSLLREAGLTAQWVLIIPASIGVLQVMGRVGLFTLERQLNVHQTNRWVPCLIPLGMVALWLGASSPFSALVFVVLYGLGNGMLTIVKGTVMAQYINQEHVGSLNGLLGIPMAFARACAPWLMGLLWSETHGYSQGIAVMIGLSLVGISALWWAQNNALQHRHEKAS